MIAIPIKKLETLLGITIQDVADMMELTKDGVYYQRRVHPEKYKIILLGMRIEKSSLTPREILNQIEPTEKLIEKLRKK